MEVLGSQVIVFCRALWVDEDPYFLQANSEDSDQTGRMPKQISVFAGCTDHFIGFCHAAAHFMMIRDTGMFQARLDK